uniref:Annexin n=1 Tax=Panagrolaimus sp. PS1159 TaxID=55785 RepID=A0AC35G6V6_9BILA
MHHQSHLRPAPDFNTTHHATIAPAKGFNPNADVETLHTAMKGMGCNKDKIIQVLCCRSNDQRQEIAKTYKVKYGKELSKELKSELSGDFEDLILALMETPVCFDAHQLHKAMAGLGTSENVLIEILVTRNNAQINELKQVYQEMYKQSLEKDIVGDTSGAFQRLLVSLSIEGEFSGSIKDGLLGIIKCIRNRNGYFAELLYNSMKEARPTLD